MKTPAHQRTTWAAHEAARVVVLYLCLVLALQGIAAARALGAGPLHRHVPSPGAGDAAGLLFSHHGHAHATDERHHHVVDDHSVQPSAAADDGSLDLAAFALTAALALLAFGLHPPQGGHRPGHVLRASTGWACSNVCRRLLFRPPRHS